MLPKHVLLALEQCTKGATCVREFAQDAALVSVVVQAIPRWQDHLESLLTSLINITHKVPETVPSVHV